MRFDAKPNVSSEWEAFGSFYFVVPQVTYFHDKHSITPPFPALLAKDLYIYMHIFWHLCAYE